MFVIPKAGLSVRDPEQGDYLPAEGRHVTLTEAWIRRRADGDVTFVPDDAAPPPFSFLLIPSGTTAQRPAPGVAGRIYTNTDLDLPQFDTGTAWVTLGGGGGSSAPSFRLLEAGAGYRLIEGGGRRLLETA